MLRTFRSPRPPAGPTSPQGGPGVGAGLLLLLLALQAASAAGGQLPPGLLERAAGGDAVAQNDLGSRYYAGRGVPRDDDEAARWIRSAAEQGYAPAQYNLGLLHFRNRGVAGTDAEAARWYGAAARQGYAPAQAGLGYLHIYGAGVEQDPVLAYMWLELAVRGAPDDLTRRLHTQRRDELADRMSPDDTREGRRLADAWRPDDNP
ncbi:MAG: tetratricopeptide repeat protein [Acidobacteria bacterium]|nr:tetratricopeptide repeat protein [Acidobacteriota bacterium]